jgi:hypothetical protein
MAMIRRVFHVATPSRRVRVEGPDRAVFAENPFRPIAAPENLTPKTTVVRLRLPRSIPADARVRLILDGDPEEISRVNSIVRLPIR